MRSNAFNVAEARAIATRILNEPPLRRHTERVAADGEIVARFALPLRICPTTNGTRHGQPRVLAKMKSDCLLLMRLQLPSTRAPWPLSGRPQVRCVRFSSVEADAYSDWAKIPVDCLVKLGILVDDRPSCIALHQWCEPAPRGNGCALIEVWTGKETT